MKFFQSFSTLDSNYEKRMAKLFFFPIKLVMISPILTTKP